jgi:glycosyltransferase involved in cell wall biosynthesis
MKRARIVVLTSRWEGLPTVAIEAMLHGALPVGFDIPALREVLGPGADALLTPSKPDALAALLSHLLDDEALRHEKSTALFNWARSRYDANRMAARYSEIYRRLYFRA